MLLGGSCIHCTQIGQPEKVRKVRLADNYEIPPSCEILVDVFLSAETTMHCKVTCILYKKQAALLFTSTISDS
jgi:hypothetical protein